MKKRGILYLPGARIIVSLVHFLCVCILLLSILISDNVIGFSTTFEKSDRYTMEVQHQTDQLIDYIKFKQNFETDGAYNPKKVVDIKAYAQTRTIDGTVGEGSVGYYLEDLVKWSQDGVEYGEYTEYETVVEDYPESISDTAVSTYPETTYTTSERYAIEEYYIPVEGESLAEMYRQTKPNTEERTAVEKLYTYLEYTLDWIYGEVTNYKRQTIDFKAENTNLRYALIEEATGTFYTNVPDSDPAETIAEMGQHLYVDSIQSVYQSTIDGITAGDLSTDMDLSRLMEDGRYIFAVGIDTTFAQADKFAELKTRSDQWQPYATLAWIGIIIGAVGTVATIILMASIAGRKKGSDEIVLNHFDRWKTEPAALLIFISAAAVAGISVNIFWDMGAYNEVSNYLLRLIPEIIAFMMLDIFFIIGFDSLCKRFKAKTLYRNSVLCVVVDRIRELLENSKVTVKLLIFYGLFLVINLVLVLSIVGLIIAIPLDIVIGYFLLRDAIDRQNIIDGVQTIGGGNLEYKIPLDRMRFDNRKIAEQINNIGDGLHNAVDASMRNERMKTDLITNVSHDIKTPLTSIINYVDLIKRENIEDEKIKGYVDILDAKSQRLKQLTEDLVEASKASSGNINLQMERLNFIELLNQLKGEFKEKFDQRNLELIEQIPEEVVIIRADGRRLWRIIENLYINITKYAMPGSRVYLDVAVADKKVTLTLKNVSEFPLNISADELTERFIRGDVSRSTEGSGLGLSIAKSLTTLQGGTFDTYLDGDLFKVILTFNAVE